MVEVAISSAIAIFKGHSVNNIKILNKKDAKLTLLTHLFDKTSDL